MHPVKIGIRRNHLRLKPDSKGQAYVLHLLHQISQTSRQLIAVHLPIPKRTIVSIPFSKPAVIHNQHFNAAFLRLPGNRKKLIRIKIKISRLPVINQNRAFLM